MSERGVLESHPPVRAGVYSTLDIRPSSTSATETTKTITLEPPHVNGTTPSIAIGLCALDMDGASNLIRLKTNLTQDPHTAHKEFAATISTWRTTKLYSAAVSWIDVPAMRGLQSGAGEAYPSSETLRDSTTDPVQLASVRFALPYVRPPRVVCWLTGLNLCESRNWRVRTFATDVDNAGFTLCAATWNDTHLYVVAATWIAIPQDAPGIFVGTYSANMHTRSGRVVFPRAFRGVPKVVVGLSLLDFENKRNLRVKAFARDITSHEFVWEVQTWHDSHMYQADITIIAIESGN